jgi:phospholipid-binding lipoprotein MlaA
MRFFLVNLMFFVVSLPILCVGTNYQNRNCEDIYDPLEPVNRKVFMVNSALDYVLLRPVAKGYREIVPKGAQMKVGNFLDNLYTPVTFVNNIFQLNFSGAMKSFWKFTFNSTFGFLGFNDLTTKRGLEVQRQRFGDTLAYYGARPGPYIVLPIYGSTNLRDMFDVVTLDKVLNPLTYKISNKSFSYFRVASIIHNRSEILPFTDNISKTSLDPYVTIRSVLHQRRESEVHYPESRKCIRNID